MTKISIENLANEIAKGLKEYSTDVVEGIDRSSEKIAKESVEKLKSNSPVGISKKKKYRNGWRVETEKRFGETNSHTIYNKWKPSLTHLLENGHANRGGGRTKGIPHIKPVEQELIDKFTKEVEGVIRNK